MDSTALLTSQNPADLGLISDTRNLASIKRLGQGSRAQQAEALKTAASQFEAILVQQWFDAVRAGSESLAPDSPLRSKYSSFFEDMLAQQQVTAMVNGQGRVSKNSITYLVAKQFARSLGDEGKELLKELTAPAGVHTPSAETQLAGAGHIKAPAENLMQSNLRAAINSFKAQYGDAVNGAVAANYRDQQDFVDKLMPHAVKVAEDTGLNPLVMLAQAALETGWGEHVPDNNNYFGIKAGGSWQGPVQELSSAEFRDGQFADEVSAFRAYRDVGESMRDYAALIQGNARYQRAAACSYDPDKYFDEIQKAGYATDPQYASKLKQIARKIAFMAYK